MQGDDGRTIIEQARRRANAERQRAAKAAALAAHHEAWSQPEAWSGPALQAGVAEFHATMAAAHRRTEERHLVAARMHHAYAQRLEAWARRDGPSANRPQFMTAVAATAESEGATLTLFDSTSTEAVVAASDTKARAAHNLESTFAEGPAHEAVHNAAPVAAHGTEVAVRWPLYGPALNELGVQSVAAVQLHAGRTLVGSLTVYDPPARWSSTDLHELNGIAGALVNSAVLDPDTISTKTEPATPPLFDREDFQPELHQAAGVLHDAHRCGIRAALALIYARAFAEGRPVESVAQEILRGGPVLL